MLAVIEIWLRKTREEEAPTGLDEERMVYKEKKRG
jgi:hypothetical protein